MDEATNRPTTALARLTENEKECLRRRLQHQTAKEMALELGISPHAVEKRLKMARLKLAVPSSLAAARLLAEAERGGPAGPQPSDLPRAATAGQRVIAAPPGPRRRRLAPAFFLAGAMPMIFAALFALLPQAAPSAASPLVPDRDAIVVLPPDAPGPHVAGQPATERVEDVLMRGAGPAEVAAFARSSFATMDKNRSGFIEQSEAPAAGVGIPAPDGGAVQWFTGPQGQAMWIANMDTDRDGRASEAEYIVWDVKIWRDHVPANWAWRK